MNSKSETDEASRGNEAQSSININPNDSEEQSSSSVCTDTSHTEDSMKRATAKTLIERYFYQLLDGCGNPNCDNKYCASSGERNLSPNEAAAEAIKLLCKEAPLCDTHPKKVPKTEPIDSTSNASTKASENSEESNNKENEPLPTCSSSSSNEGKESTSQEGNVQMESSHDLSQYHKNILNYNQAAVLTEELVYKLCEESLMKNTKQPLVKALGKAFTQPTVLSRCFARKIPPDNANCGEKDCDEESKESMSSDPDKDIDSITGPELDIASCRRAFAHLAKVPPDFYSSVIVTSLKTLGVNLEIDLWIKKKMSVDEAVNCLIIAFELPDLPTSDYLSTALPALCRAAEQLPTKGQAKLARMWAQHCKNSLQRILETLQQMITLRAVSTTYTNDFQVQEDEPIIVATKLMKIVYYASMMAGTMEPNTLREESIFIDHYDATEMFTHWCPSVAKPEDPLALELGVNVLDCREPYLQFEDFYNESLCDVLEMDVDFGNYKSEISKDKKFAFLHYPFILTPATKSMGLYYDNRIRMYAEQRVSLLNAVFGSVEPTTVLRLKVRRTHIIEDALVELEVVAMQRSLDLKKQLVVEFEGEQGVDEGGVSKEFFHLIVEEIFNADFGMFTHQPESHTVWFNPSSFETEAQFTLIGIVLGLAIYNNVILAVNFPMVLYRKLLGKKGSFEDLIDWDPTLYNSLKDMLEYTEDDLEEVYCQPFRICYQNVFGSNVLHDLKENGENIFVTQENKKEFVDLYADFLLNSSVEKQFKAFRRGFLMVTDESPLAEWFRPEEVEMLVCGSKELDFGELEESTEYEGGYTAESRVVRELWSVVHALEVADKRRFLQFATGSDRVPVGGLRRVRLVVARHGPDAERLPAAHTCFNVLLLPEYASRDKLRDRLLKAISYAQGFGLL